MDEKQKPRNEEEIKKEERNKPGNRPPDSDDTNRDIEKMNEENKKDNK